MKSYKFLPFLILIFALCFSASCVQQNSAADEPAETETETTLASPADSKIEEAKTVIYLNMKIDH